MTKRKHNKGLYSKHHENDINFKRATITDDE